MAVKWTVEDITDLERILIRARAEARSERDGAMRLHGAYAAERTAINDILVEAEARINETTKWLRFLGDLEALIED